MVFSKNEIASIRSVNSPMQALQEEKPAFITFRREDGIFYRPAPEIRWTPEAEAVNPAAEVKPDAGSHEAAAPQEGTEPMTPGQIPKISIFQAQKAIEMAQRISAQAKQKEQETQKAFQEMERG